MDKNDITLNYAFQEYIPEKALENKGIKDVAPVLTYEEPRWTFKNTSEAMNIIKESDASLYEKIQDYVKKQHLPSENTLQLDFGKSLHYDDEYSKETLSDNRFIVRYSHDNDEGNLIDGGDEIIINDEKIVSLFNGMIEEHVKENIQKYNEYNKPFTPSEYVLSKLKEKGIEVVTDKEEFDRILESQNILQKLESHSTEEKNPLFLVNKNELKAFAQKIDDWKAGNLKPTEVISEFSTSTVLQAINIPANKVSVTQDVLHKINELETVKVGKSYGHDIDIATIKKIPEFLADPVMVFGSASTPGSYVIMSETIDKKNRTIMVAMEINKQNANVIVNNITSAYGRNDNNFFIEQIKLGNLVYQNKQKSLEWTNERGLPLPPQMSTQGSLNVIQKEDIVKQKTPNFSFSERHFAFTENQQEFLRELGFTNSVDGDNSVLDWKMSKTIPETNKIIYFETGADKGRVNCFACYEIDESKDNVVRTDLLRRYAEEKNAFEGFLTSISFNDRQNNFIVPYEKLGKVLSDEILEKLTDYIDDKAPKISRENFSNDIIDVAFKNKVRNLPARFISEDIYSSGINSIGKKLTFKVYKEVLKIAGVPVDDKKHYLLKIQTDNNYEYVHNKDYPRLYEAKWNRIKQAYTDEVELNLNSFNSKTIGNIQYIAANNYNYPNPPAQTMTLSDGTTYGFAHNGKIYLNPDVLSAEVAMHEYTHLWDNLTRKDNPELWNKGLQIFKGTSLWNEVVNDENYQDIKDDENLVLSECHARITGKVTEAVLNRIAEQDGTAKQAEMIDWDKETINFIFDNYRDIFAKNGFETVAEFTSATMKELFNPVEQQKRDISINSSALKDSWIWKDYDDLSGHLESPDGQSYFEYDWTTKEYKITSDSSWDSFIDADPTQDTSLSAFKDYAQDYIKNNIAKHKDIVFEREYIDTEKWLEEEEKEMIKTESLADKYNRMEKLFEGKMSHLGSGDGETFKELCKWVEEEFSEKDSEGVLLEATSRMIEENLDFGEFNYQAFDDVYGFGEGAEWRLDFSDFVAKKLLSGEIITLSDAQSLIWEKAEKEFAGLKNNSQYKDEIEITDRINSAFRIADFLYPEFTKEIDKEKNLLPDEWPQYSNEEKKNVINNAFEHLDAAFKENRVVLDVYDEDRLIIVDKSIPLKDFETLIKGHDAVNFGKKSLSFVRPNAEQLHDGIENGWKFDEITAGYAIFQNTDLNIKGGFTPKFISKLDDMNVFKSDGDAAKQYGIDHNCRILEEKKDIWIGDEDLEYYSYPDIPENRRIMKENGWLLEQPLEFDFSEFTEKDFNRIRDELFKDNPKEDYYGRLHIGSLHVEFVINQNDGWVDTNYYILGEKGEGETQFGVPYGHFPGHQFIANLFTDNTYEEFKEKVSAAVLDDIAEEGTLKPEAMRPLVDWNDEQQGNELYHTKLVESARVNEIVIAPYSREERDVEVVRDFVSKIVNLPVLGVPDDMVFAVLDNIGRVQDENPGDFLKIRKDGSVEHISALGPVEKEPVEVLHIINSFAEDHASVSEEGSQQRKDYEYINSLYEKMAEKNVTVDAPSVDSYKEMLEIIQEQIEKASGIKVDERIADEIYSLYKDHDLTLKYNENGSFTVYDDANGKYTNPITINDAVKQVMAWDDKELSELHPGTADDETIGKIKGYLEELEHVNEQIVYNQNVTLKDVNEKLKELNIENKEFKVTHSVTFPCGFTFPDSAGKTEREQNNYRKKIYKKLQDKYGFNDNDAETEYFPGATPSESSFNISFSVSVPEEIQNNPEKVNKWIEGVENYVKEECGCTFINWQGGERYEQIFVNEKQYKMQQERNSDFAHPNADDLEFASPKDIKEYCKLNSEIELTDEQVREIHNFYDNNDQFALYVSPAGNLYVRDEYDGNLISADSELLKAGNHLRTLEGKERLEYLLKNTSNDEPEWSKGLLNQTSNDSDERLRIVSDVLSDSFATLDRHDGFWQLLLDYGADPTRAIRIAAEDSNLGDNLNWLLNNVPESQLNQIFSDNGYADTVFDIAKKSVEHDMDSWHGGEDIGFEGFKRIARLCEREADADRYYGELLEKVFFKPVEPKIVQLLDTPELLAEKMNAQRIHQNEPEITKEQASAILDYCNYENIKFYIAKDGGIYSLDVSEDYNGEGLKESNFGIAANGIEYARKAQNLNYSCYSTVTFNMVSELWQKERQFVNPSVKNTISTFTDNIDTLIENNIKEYLRREYAETYPNSGKFEVTVENQSYPIDKDELDYIANSDEWGSVEDRLNDVIDRRFEEEIEQKENDILSDVQEYIAQETNGNLILKDSELREVLFSEELVQIYAPKEDFLANQPEEVKAALVEAGIARSELYNNVDKEPLEIVKELADKKELSEVPDLFKKSFIRAINQTSSSKDPFIITKSIINKWKVSKPKYIPVLNNYLKKQNCSSKEGFEKFFNELVKSSKQKKIEKKTSKDNNFVLSR